jgi:hypothetical protein
MLRNVLLITRSRIFRGLCRGEFFDFPGPFEQAPDIIGSRIARRAVAERRNIVTEVIGAEPEPLEALRNLNRRDNEISAYYAEAYQRDWLRDAAGALKR